jgi:two-component system, OmpR family, response regulator QseB
MNVLLVEDDLEFGNGIRIALTDQSMTVTWVRRLTEAFAALDSDAHDIVLLDLGLPDGDGITLLSRLRRDRQALPVLVMTARDSLSDRLLGLDTGADDYLVKPFALAELLSRVRALARRSYGYQGDTLELRGVVIHEPTMRVTVNNQTVELSRSEYLLLAAMIKRADRVLTRRILEEQVLQGGSGGESNTLEVHISNLRRKVGNELIRTVRGVGYVIDKTPAKGAR